MRSVAYGAWQLLINASIGVGTAASSSDWLLRTGAPADGHDRQITLFDTGGTTPNTKWLLDFPTIQALIRGQPYEYDVTYSKAYEVKDALLGIDPFDFEGDHWTGITGLSDVAFLGNDKNSRPLFSVNFRVIMERAKSSLSHRDPL